MPISPARNLVGSGERSEQDKADFPSRWVADAMAYSFSAAARFRRTVDQLQTTASAGLFGRWLKIFCRAAPVRNAAHRCNRL
jgi:hypothetical protein